MKAILHDHPGGPEVLYYGEAPDPVPSHDELLIRVRAAGVNRAEVLQRRGAYPPPPGVTPILGLEVAGEVVQGAPGYPFQLGDRVMAVVSGGAYAELATVPAAVALRIPDPFSFEQAAAIPEAFLTAYLNLFTLGKLGPGQTVLIHAAGSGVGTAAIQLARAAGATVIATAGTAEKLARCQELGAALTINYKEEAFAPRVKDFTNGHGADVILDFVGAGTWEGNTACAAIGGRIMLIGFLGGGKGQLDLTPILAKSLTVTGTTLRRTPLLAKAELCRAFETFAAGKWESGALQPIIDSVYPLTEAAEAHRRMEANLNLGKIILTVGS
jgi:putative PIG3 family NAD(P)H quinone oxidoreductase